MTKIKLDIDSDKEIIQAVVNIQYADGNDITKEVINTEVPVQSTVNNRTTFNNKKGVDEAFTRSY